MRLQLLGVGSVPVLTIKGDDDSIINLSALARYLGMKRSTLFDHINAKGLEMAIREAAIEKRKKKLEK